MIAFSGPLMQRTIFALAISIGVCLVTIFLIRRLRGALTEEDSAEKSHSQPERFPLDTYHAVIQELKQQKHELQTAQQAERRRAKTSENISAAILSHLSSGVMFFTPNGLIRQANAAAKNLLGYASPVGMSALEVFRSTKLTAGSSSEPNVASVIGAALQDEIPEQALEIQYVTPAGARRVLEITLTSVRASGGEALGIACLITDKTEVATIHQQEKLRGELSAEMRLALRTSLAAINGYARQIGGAGDQQRTRELATDIVSEAAQLEQTLGSFLAGKANAAGA